MTDETFMCVNLSSVICTNDSYIVEILNVFLDVYCRLTLAEQLLDPISNFGL